MAKTAGIFLSVFLLCSGCVSARYDRDGVIEYQKAVTRFLSEADGRGAAVFRQKVVCATKECGVCTGRDEFWQRLEFSIRTSRGADMLVVECFYDVPAVKEYEAAIVTSGDIHRRLSFSNGNSNVESVILPLEVWSYIRELAYVATCGERAIWHPNAWNISAVIIGLRSNGKWQVSGTWAPEIVFSQNSEGMAEKGVLGALKISMLLTALSQCEQSAMMNAWIERFKFGLVGAEGMMVLEKASEVDGGLSESWRVLSSMVIAEDDGPRKTK